MSLPSMFVSISKTVNETISLTADFTDYLQGSETIVTRDVSVSVFSGNDQNPDNTLFMSSFLRGDILEQRIRLGLPGVIYSFIFAVTTSAGNVYEQNTRLAVLPNVGTAIPVFSTIFLTSQLYPLQAFDSWVSAINLQGGTLLLNPRSRDDYTTGITITSGILSLAHKFYTAPPVDFYISGISIADGTITLANVIYNMPPDDFYYTSIAILNGTLAPGQVFYTMEPENYATSILIQSGTLS